MIPDSLQVIVLQRFTHPDLQQLASPFHNWYPTPLLASKLTTQDYAYSATVTGTLLDCISLKKGNLGVLFVYYIVLDVPGGSSNLGHWKAYPPGRYPTTRVNVNI